MIRLTVTGNGTGRDKLFSTLDGVLKRNPGLFLMTPYNPVKQTGSPAEKLAYEWGLDRRVSMSTAWVVRPSHAVVYGEGESPEGAIVMRVPA